METAHTQLLDQLLVLLQLLQVLDAHLVHADLLGLLAMLVVSKHAHLHLRPRGVGQLHSAAETLVLLWVIVLEPDLQLDRLRKLALLGLGAFKNS
jgi:hypothetical protein